MGHLLPNGRPWVGAFDNLVNYKELYLNWYFLKTEAHKISNIKRMFYILILFLTFNPFETSSCPITTPKNSCWSSTSHARESRREGSVVWVVGYEKRA